jgi:hypothetical protein
MKTTENIKIQWVTGGTRAWARGWFLLGRASFTSFTWETLLADAGMVNVCWLVRLQDDDTNIFRSFANMWLCVKHPGTGTGSKARAVRCWLLVFVLSGWYGHSCLCHQCMSAFCAHL